MSESTAVTTSKASLPAAYADEIQRRKERNAVATAIRGTQWSKEVSETVVRAVAEYAHRIGADPVRHVEVLGGRIYLTADYYREKGAPLIASGLVSAPQLEHIAADPRLDTLAAGTTSRATWASEERDRRMAARIEHGVPEGAKAAVICRIAVRGGSVVEGVNWVGGSSKRDPVGDSEPTKTAESRAERRAWRRLVEVMPSMAPEVARAEQIRADVNAAIPEGEVTPWGKEKELPMRAPVPKLSTGATNELLDEVDPPTVRTIVGNPPVDVSFLESQPEGAFYDPD